MKEAYWGYWLIVLGVFVIVVLLLVQSFTSTNSQDFYLVKSIAEASMEDAIDWGYYRQFGEAKINKEKFYESFLRRFAEEASIATTYDIEFTDVYEAPPKIGVKVSSKANTFSINGDSESFDIVNKIDAILEANGSSQAVSSTIIGEQKVSATYLKDYLQDNGSQNTLSKCKMQFGLGDCETDSEVDITVVSCGVPTEKGVQMQNLDSGTVYCIAHKSTNDACSITASYDQFVNNYCN